MKDKIKKCCSMGSRRIKIVDDKLRSCMFPKPKPKEKHIVYDTGVVILGAVKFCPHCGKKVEVV